MKYTILSLNDDRKAYKDEVRKNVQFEEIFYPAVNGNVVDFEEELSLRGLEWDDCWSNAKRGEMGVWLSNFDRWMLAAEQDVPLIVFEDDAVVEPNFMEDFRRLREQLPSDWDFVALWVPENQRIDYMYDLEYDHCGNPRINRIREAYEGSLFEYGASHTSLVYQGYGMVSLMYSPTGAAKLVQLAREYGITGPVDCWVYQHAHMGNLKGYAPKPLFAEIVKYDWQAQSHVQLTEKVL